MEYLSINLPLNIIHYCLSLLITIELKFYQHGKLKLYITLIRSNPYSLNVFVEYYDCSFAKESKLI